MDLHFVGCQHHLTLSSGSFDVVYSAAGRCENDSLTFLNLARLAKRSLVVLNGFVIGNPDSFYRKYASKQLQVHLCGSQEHKTLTSFGMPLPGL